MERAGSQTVLSVLARLALILPPAAVAGGLAAGPTTSEAVAACWYGSGVVCGCDSGGVFGCGRSYQTPGSYCGAFSGPCQEVFHGCQYYSGCGGY